MNIDKIISGYKHSLVLSAGNITSRRFHDVTCVDTILIPDFLLIVKECSVSYCCFFLHL